MPTATKTARLLLDLVRLERIEHPAEIVEAADRLNTLWARHYHTNDWHERSPAVRLRPPPTRQNVKHLALSRRAPQALAARLKRLLGARMVSVTINETYPRGQLRATMEVTTDARESFKDWHLFDAPTAEEMETQIQALVTRLKTIVEGFEAARGLRREQMELDV